MRTVFRPLAVACALLLSVTVLAGPASADPSGRGASWLARQLTNGLIHNDQYDFDDYGLTADTGLALDKIGGHGADVRAIRRALARHINSWTTGVDFGSDDVYAGSVAKAIVFAQAAGADPRSYGGVNLVVRLNKRVSTVPRLAGRIQDKAESDFANTIGQAFAAAGLSRADSPKAGKVVRYLLKQQCSPGYFRLYFSKTTAKNQTCDGARKRVNKAPDTDVTALAVLMLRDVKPKTKAVRGAIRDAVGWLRRKQADNGAFGGGPATEANNANSTGLAGWALGEAGACRAAQNAARWVRRLQVRGDVSGTPLAGESGAIAYNRAAFRDARRHGIGAEQQDQWRRATAQAAPGLIYLKSSACRR